MKHPHTYKWIRTLQKEIRVLDRKKPTSEVFRDIETKEEELLSLCKDYNFENDPVKVKVFGDLTKDFGGQKKLTAGEMLLQGDRWKHLLDRLKSESASSEEVIPQQISSLQPLEEPKYVFLKTGPGWKIVFDGREISPLKGRGFDYIHYCMEHYDKEFTNVELYELVFGKSEEPSKTDKNEFNVGTLSRQNLADPKAIIEIKERLNELKRDLFEAEKDNDFARIYPLREEKEQIEDHLKDYEHMGKLKTFKTSGDAISGNVSKNIDRAIKRIGGHDKEAYAHFNEAFKYPFSSTKKYKPSKPISWVLK